AGRLPPPLDGSPKCAGCSLVGICLPDETAFLTGAPAPGAAPGEEIRRLYPILPDALPLYVQDQGAYVGKRDGTLVVRLRKETVAEVPLMQVSQVAVFGAVQVSTQALQELCGGGIPVCFFSHGGWFYGMAAGFGSRNIELRRAQFRRADDADFRLALSRRIVQAKIKNQRTVLRRNSSTVPDDVLRRLDDLAGAAGEAPAVDTLLGIEGSAARLYFGHFASLLRGRDGSDGLAFDFHGRNRRPPRDPVNAMLSLCYALLAKDFGVTAFAVGFDPHLGFFHTAHHGRQSLALDLMEEFRPIVADSTVFTAVNNGEIVPGDFVRAAGSVSLKPAARRTLIQAYERRMAQTITHPVFGYKVSYRKTMEVQARLLARHVLGELAEFPPILVR
ncbi:MAG: CRISPR-associated endonuclease Cas1, partial [Myxococcota bacterium]|nr:CRISPR-associated endonuclease Cas1 [Myxococcota bacterium]